MADNISQTIKIVNESRFMAAQVLAEEGALVLPVFRFIADSLHGKEGDAREPERDDPRWRVVALAPLTAATTNEKEVRWLWRVTPCADVAVVCITCPMPPAMEQQWRRGKYIPDNLFIRVSNEETARWVLKYGRLSLHIHYWWQDRSRECDVPVEQVRWPEPEKLNDDILALFRKVQNPQRPTRRRSAARGVR